MKTRSTFTALALAFVALLAGGTSAHAQRTAKEASDTLRALNIQIGEASLAGDKARVQLLQNRYMDIQRKWDVDPTPGPRRHAPVPEPAPVKTTWTDSKNGSGTITGYRGGKIGVKRAYVHIPTFWDVFHKVTAGGKGIILKFTDSEGNVYTYSGNWTWRGNLSASLNVGDGDGGLYNGTLNMDQEGISTISLVGYGEAKGYNISFSH